MGQNARFEGSELLGVRPLGLQRFGEVELTRIELYADGVAFGWQNRGWRFGWASEFALEDDLGTSYVSLGAYAGGSFGQPHPPRGLMRGESVFAPAPPADASWVRLRQGDDAAEISLTGIS
jgi:hypothetical protein